jgi:hypothetical protein
MTSFRKNRMPAALAWTVVTAGATAAIALLAVEAVSPLVEQGTQPADAPTLSPWWALGFLLCLPVFMVARRSALLALPAVAVAGVPQFYVATAGVERMRGDVSFAGLTYLSPIGMTALCLLAAAIGTGLRLHELHARPEGATGAFRQAEPPSPLDRTGQEALGHLPLQHHEEHHDGQDGDQGARRQRSEVE